MSMIKSLMVGLAVLLLVSSSLLISQEGQASAEDQKMMEAWMKYSTPGDNHKYLESFTGEWEGESKMWMKPGAPPTVSKVSLQGEMILGGRYLKVVYKGDMGGMPFEGIGTTAYDNHLKKFVSVWIDSFSTGIFRTEGTLEEKTRTETGDFYNILDNSSLSYRQVTTLIAPDQFSMDMYEKHADGKEFKTMEMVVSKKK